MIFFYKNWCFFGTFLGYLRIIYKRTKMKTIATIALLITTTIVNAQYNKQQTQLFITNAAFGGVVSGIGACINKKSNQTYFNAFTNGFWKGSIGGALCYTGKRINYQIVEKENLIYGWPAKLFNSLGTSMMENGSYNRGLIEQMHLYFGPTRFDYNFKYNNFQTRILPASIFTSINIFIKNGRFNLKKSLLLGNFVFKNTFNSDGFVITGTTNFNIIQYTSEFQEFQEGDMYYILAHENIHSFQNEQFDVMMSYMNFNLYKKVTKYIFVEDLFVSSSIYYFYKEPFENEAYSISQHNFIKY